MLRLGEFFEQGFKLQPEKDPKALDVPTPASARHTLFRLAPLLYRRRP